MMCAKLQPCSRPHRRPLTSAEFVDFAAKVDAELGTMRASGRKVALRALLWLPSIVLPCGHVVSLGDLLGVAVTDRSGRARLKPTSPRLRS